MDRKQQMLAESLDPISIHARSLWFSRLLVVALSGSFVMFLGMLWLSGTFGAVPVQWQTIGWLHFHFITTHHLPLLVVPVVSLAFCYVVLRILTGEITSVPERYLDERQKMLYNQAHRSAFKLIKAACVLIPLAFVFAHLLPTQSPQPLTMVSSVSSPEPKVFHILTAEGQGKENLMANLYPAQVMRKITWTIQQPSPNLPPTTPGEIALVAGLLLCCLFLLASALPMAVLAWKGITLRRTAVE